MKKTVEFLKKNGIVERIQSTIDFAPKCIVEEGDPNIKGLQKQVLNDALGSLSEKKRKEFCDALFDDVIYALNIKKKDKEGDKVASLLVELLKEVSK